MDWLEPRSRTQIRMFRYYLKLRKMPDDRLTKQIYIYDQYFMQKNPNLQCWSSEIKQIMYRNNLVFSVDNVPPKLLCKNLENVLLSKDLSMFRNQCLKSPKLRTYNSLFSPFDDQYLSENFSRLCLPFREGCGKKKPEKMWSFAKLPSRPRIPPLPVWHFFKKKIYPHFFC